MHRRPRRYCVNYWIIGDMSYGMWGNTMDSLVLNIGGGKLINSVIRTLAGVDTMRKSSGSLSLGKRNR